MWSISGKKNIGIHIIDTLVNKIPEKPQVAVILGSGLGNFVEKLQNKIIIPYKTIKNYPKSTIIGHAGEWVFGYINEKPIICASGRFHIYEGFSFKQVVLPINSINELGCKNIIITNSSGCLSNNWNIGDFMLIRGFLDYTFSLNKGKPKIIKFQIDEIFIEKIKLFSKNIGINLRQGIYTWTLGPSYETPEEIKDIISYGGNAVGMSTVPEIIEALKLNLNIIGLSCLTNYGAGMDGKTLTHADVIKVSNKLNKEFSDLLIKIISMDEFK